MPGQEPRLLALDGGGVRGLSLLIILEQLMETINPDSPPKPCDYFDMIGGTSTGGLIAIMLGRLKLSIDECVVAYLSLSDRVFEKKRHRVTVRGSIQGRFDSKELELAVKEVITKQGLDKDALLKDVSENTCKVFVCATSKQTCETVCLRSYKSSSGSNDLLNSVKIWEACRATSAASSFFDPIAIGRYALEDKIQCLVSIGTGVPSLELFRDDVFHLGTTLAAIATETEQTAGRFRRDKPHLDNANRYYRFNVTRGLESIGLEESKKRKEIAAVTRRYVGMQDVLKQMQACADNTAHAAICQKTGTPRPSVYINQASFLQNAQKASASNPSPTVYIFSHQDPRFYQDTRDNLLSERKLRDLAEVMEDYSKITGMSDYRKACNKAMQKVINNSSFQAKYTCQYGEYRDKSFDNEPRAKIHVFCPPLLEYIHFALALAPPDEALKTCEFKIVIHPDTRLLDPETYRKEEGDESLLQLYKFVYSNAGLEEPLDEFVLREESERRQGYLATRFDQVWMDQRIMAITIDESPPRALDASEYLSELKGDGQVASIVIMAASQVCDSIISSAPLAGPDYPIQQSEIYELEKRSGASNSSPVFWKTKHFCRIVLSSHLQ